MRLCLTVLASATLATTFGFSNDWPQWRGPDRNEISKETGIRTNFTSGSPKVLWSYDKAGSGYSGPAVVGNVLYCLGADGKDFVFALDTETGKEVWRTELGERFKNGYGDGPRSTPTIDGDRLYCIRGGGGLQCLNIKDGSKVWDKSFTADFNGIQMGPPRWGFSESPLIDGDKLLCSPGGSDGAIVALAKNTGDLIWRCKELKDPATYSSIIAADVDGVHQYIQVTEHGVAGVKAEDGSLLWVFDRPGQRIAVIPTPIYHDNHVYVTAGYGCGCALIKLTKDGDKFKAEEVYANKNLSNHHGGVVLLDGCVYGGSDAIECQDFMTGKVKWKGDGPGRPKKPSVTCVEGHLFCYDEGTGICYVIEASPKGYKETGQIKIPKQSTIRSRQGKIWTHPVIANGKLYLRDQDLLFCFDVKQ